MGGEIGAKPRGRNGVAGLALFCPVPFRIRTDRCIYATKVEAESVTVSTLLHWQQSQPPPRCAASRKAPRTRNQKAYMPALSTTEVRILGLDLGDWLVMFAGLTLAAALTLFA